ncbi:MAG: class I SAM-dependent methyltransferase [Candidatus Magasanikbacteria bacterium]|nr:class I SAM-dependent methyltransferase [Candidatus Magasanikbacteria bacterium]
MKHADYCASYLNPGAEVLDIGAGRGTFLKEMAKRGFRVSGIEVNPVYIEEIKNLAEQNGISFDLRAAKAEELPYPDGQFDFVNASEVTEHVEDPLLMSKELYRVLKTGGSAYISFHNRWGAYDYHYHMYGINWMPRSWTEPVLDFLHRQKEDGIAGRQKLITMHYVTYSEAERILQQAGFYVFQDIREMKIKKKFGFWFFPFFLLYRCFRPWYFNSFHILLKK